MFTTCESAVCMCSSFRERKQALLQGKEEKEEEEQRGKLFVGITYCKDFVSKEEEKNSFSH